MTIANAETVAQAANSLKNKGINVTHDAIREVLGGGSLTTIGKHLRAWKDAESGVPDVPESVVQVFDTLRSSVWGEAFKAAAAASESDAAELVQAQADVERLEAELAATKTAAEAAEVAAQSRYDDVNGKLSDCFTELQNMTRERDQLAAEKAAQAAEIAELRQRLIDSEKATARAEGALEAFKSMQK